jgi:hypothetical protein
LGIFDRLWDLLEEACTNLDLHLAEHNSGGTFDNTFSRYITALSEKAHLKEKLKSLTQTITLLDQLITYFSLHLPNPSQCQSLATVQQEAANKRVEAKRVVSM